MFLVYHDQSHQVSIHASSREDATSHVSTTFKGHCFNPRVLAGGRDRDHQQAVIDAQVSIHASSREDATELPVPAFKIIGDSIHASSREDATGKSAESTIRNSFNPRVLAGGRDVHIHRKLENLEVSIHASSREDATNAPQLFSIVSVFQSTRPRGRTRHVFRRNFIRNPSFNPRVLAGGRDETFHYSRPAFRFQSTRPRGRTRQLTNRYKKAIEVSIHASSREDATCPSWVVTPTVGFNPRVLAGGRDPQFLFDSYMRLFQSTRPRGRTRR